MSTKVVAISPWCCKALTTTQLPTDPWMLKKWFHQISTARTTYFECLLEKLQTLMVKQTEGSRSTYRKWSDNTAFYTFWIILTWTCVSRHSAVHFFGIWSPKTMWFVHFGLNMRGFWPTSFQNWPEPFISFQISDTRASKREPRLSRSLRFLFFGLETCFVPKRRAIFPHPNFQKWSDADAFSTFWIENAFHATAAHHSSTSELSKLARNQLFFNMFTLKCASRYSSVVACHFSPGLNDVAPQRFAIFHFSSHMAVHPPL